MKKVLIIALAISLAMVGFAFAVGVVDSLHDLRTDSSNANLLGTGSGQVCVMCHHPHRGSPGSELAGDDYLLWNITKGAYEDTYETYSGGGSINASDGGTALTTSGDALYSYLCMGCHDGTLSANALVREPRDGKQNTISLTLTTAANLGTTLADDHPVNFTFDDSLATNDGELTTPSAGKVAGQYPLFGDTMQCATCHDVHRGGLTSGTPSCTDGDRISCDANIEFMLGNTASSEICTDCHIK